MMQLTNTIFYTSSTRTPLSAEVFFIHKNNQLYIYDVGNGEIEFPQIHKNVVLSHFHPDHITNINKIFEIALHDVLGLGGQRGSSTGSGSIVVLSHVKFLLVLCFFE